MISVSEVERRKAAVDRAQTVADRLGGFFREELEAASAGDMERLAELNEKRPEIESGLGELEAVLSLLARDEEGGEDREGEFSKLKRTVEEMAAAAREAHLATGKLKESALEGLRVLAVVRRAAASYHGRRQVRGTILDREG